LSEIWDDSFKQSTRRIGPERPASRQCRLEDANPKPMWRTRSSTSCVKLRADSPRELAKRRVSKSWLKMRWRASGLSSGLCLVRMGRIRPLRPSCTRFSTTKGSDAKLEQLQNLRIRLFPMFGLSDSARVKFFRDMFSSVHVNTSSCCCQSRFGVWVML
jgi:hypothetical protein